MKKKNQWKSLKDSFKKKALIQYHTLKLKYKYPIIFMVGRLFTVIEITLLLIIILTILNFIGFTNIAQIKKISEFIPMISPEINKQLVFAQLSLTFIITSLFSLLIGLKKEMVLGTSIYSIIFHKSFFGNLILLSIFVFVTLFMNIFFFLKDNESLTILPLFLATLLSLTIMILKVIIFTNSSKLSVEKIGSIYLAENKKMILHSLSEIFNKKKESSYLYDLSEDTHEKILNKNIQFTQGFFALATTTELSLHKRKNEIQKAHYLRQDIHTPKDSIYYWSSGISALVREGFYAHALRQYIRMMNMFVEHEVFISSSDVNQLLKEILKGISINKDQLMVEQNKNSLHYAMVLTMKYSYYAMQNDFSYGSTKLRILSPIYGGFLSDYYNIIDKQIPATDIEKRIMVNDFFESLRRNAEDITDLEFYKRLTITKYDFFESEAADLAPLGIPLSELLIQLVRDDKKGRILHLLREFKHDAINYACLIVATKLTSLFFNVSKKERKSVESSLMIFLKKLSEWDSYKIKTNYNHLLLNYDSEVYEQPAGLFTDEDYYYLSLVKQTIMMKKYDINVTNICFSDGKLSILAKTFYRIEGDFLDKQWRIEIEKFEKKYGVLHLL